MDPTVSLALVDAGSEHEAPASVTTRTLLFAPEVVAEATEQEEKPETSETVGETGTANAGSKLTVTVPPLERAPPEVVRNCTLQVSTAAARCSDGYAASAPSRSHRPVPPDPPRLDPRS